MVCLRSLYDYYDYYYYYYYYYYCHLSEDVGAVRHADFYYTAFYVPYFLADFAYFTHFTLTLTYIYDDLHLC